MKHILLKNLIRFPQKIESKKVCQILKKIGCHKSPCGWWMEDWKSLFINYVME